MRQIILYLFIFINILSCNTKKNSIDYTDEKVILSGKQMVNLRIQNYSNGKVKYIIDSLNGNKFGNFFKFYQNSSLESYSFLTSQGQSTYVEIFDSTDHSLKDIKGIPFVYKTIDADAHPDSLFIEYLVSDFSWDDVKVSYWYNGEEFKSLELSDHPELKFIKVAKIHKYTKLIPRFNLIAKYEGCLKKSGESRAFLDTIDISKNIAR